MIPFRKKTVETENHTLNSKLWDYIAMCEGDVVVSSYMKSGTTWIQQILGQLLFSPGHSLPLSRFSVWVDYRCTDPTSLKDLCENLARPRIFKSHLDAESLDIYSQVKYIYIMRDPRDVVLSLFDHHAQFLLHDLINRFPGRVGPALPHVDEDVIAYYRSWLLGNGWPYWPYWDHIMSWWAIRNFPNVFILNYDDLIQNFETSIRGLANFIGVEPSLADMGTVADYTSFKYMKSNANLMIGDHVFRGGAATFINKGVSGRWRTVMPEKDSVLFEEFAQRHLSQECRAKLMPHAAGFT